MNLISEKVMLFTKFAPQIGLQMFALGSGLTAVWRSNFKNKFERCLMREISSESFLKKAHRVKTGCN